MQVKGEFEILSMGEDTYFEAESGAKLTRANGAQRFSGGIEGEGSVEWLMCYLPDGTARFVGLQLIEGALGDHRGRFVIESVGTHDGERSRGTWSVIEGTGTGGLSGIRGDGTFEAPSGPLASFVLQFEIDRP
jgi:hypothetical protein